MSKSFVVLIFFFDRKIHNCHQEAPSQLKLRCTLHTRGFVLGGFRKTVTFQTPIYLARLVSKSPALLYPATQRKCARCPAGACLLFAEPALTQALGRQLSPYISH